LTAKLDFGLDAPEGEIQPLKGQFPGASNFIARLGVAFSTIIL
jgi:hypothetical protein